MADCGVEYARVETGHAAPAQVMQRRQVHRHAAQQRGIHAGHVFQQQGQRERGQVAAQGQVQMEYLH